MRAKIVVSGVALLATVAFAAIAATPASPQQPVAAPQQPSVQAQQAPKGSFRIERVMAAPDGTPTYQGGKIKLTVLLFADTPPGPAQNVTVKVAMGSTTVSETIQVKAGVGNYEVKLTDNAGLESSCAERDYDVEVAGTTIAQHWHIVPRCTFSSSTTNPWDQLTPDHEQSLQQDSLFIWSANVQAQPTCTTGLKAIVTVRNNSSISAPSIVLNASANNTVKATAPAFAINAKKDASVTLTPYGAQGGEPTTPLVLNIVDWEKHMTGHVPAQGFTINTIRSCVLEMAPGPAQAK
jgi:hypothetical protein